MPTPPGTAVTLDAFTDRYAQLTHGMTASEIRALFAVASRPEVVSLAGGMPNLSALPLDVVGKLMGELVQTRGAQALQYGSGQGDPHLRELICDVMALEGVRASSEDVVVTVGSQQALDLVTRVFIDPGDVVGDELRAEALGLAAEIGHHLGPHHAVGVPGVVLDVARDHQLAAPLKALDHERLQVGARRVQRGRIAGRPTADDDQLPDVLIAQSSPLKISFCT